MIAYRVKWMWQRSKLVRFMLDKDCQTAYREFWMTNSNWMEIRLLRDKLENLFLLKNRISSLNFVAWIQLFLLSRNLLQASFSLKCLRLKILKDLFLNNSLRLLKKSLLMPSIRWFYYDEFENEFIYCVIIK